MLFHTRLSRRLSLRVRQGTETGLALVELLIAMGLGAFLSAVMSNAFLASQRAAFYDEQTARMQENGRYALRLLSSELSAAGFFGGAASLEGLAAQTLAGDCAEERWALDVQVPLQWVNDSQPNEMPQTVDDVVYTCLDPETIIESTDLLAIKRTASAASARGGVVAPGLTRSSGEIWYLIVNEGLAVAWEKHRPRDLRALAASNTQLDYWEAIARIFFIRSYSQDKRDSIPSLCMETLAGNSMTARCLVEGVENLQLEFGLDTNADGVANRYTHAPNVNELHAIVSARVHLLIRSVARIPGYRDDKSYRLGNTVVEAPMDAYLRRVYSATVILGNRVKALG